MSIDQIKAIFLDRDGTIIKDKHYLYKPQEIEYFPWTFEAFKLFQNNGFKLFLVTNQSGIGRGFFSVEQMHEVHEKIQNDMIENHLEPFVDIAFCPHAPDQDCLCRKPSAGMIHDLVNRHHLDPGQSYMLGDKESDVLSGIKANLKGSYLIEKEKDLLYWARKIG